MNSYILQLPPNAVHSHALEAEVMVEVEEIGRIVTPGEYLLKELTGPHSILPPSLPPTTGELKVKLKAVPGLEHGEAMMMGMRPVCSCWVIDTACEIITLPLFII